MKAAQYLRTVLYLYAGPAAGATYAGASWKNTTSGTYSGHNNDARNGIGCGAIGASGGFILGANAEVYRQALARRGHNVDPTSPNSVWQIYNWSGANPNPASTAMKKNSVGGANTAAGVWVFGEGLVDLCSMFDIVIQGDFMPAELVRDIKRRSRRPNGTKVISGLHAVEVINQAVDNNSLTDPFRVLLKSKLLRSNVNGTFSTNKYLDQGEDNAYTGVTSDAIPPVGDAANSNHTWIVNFIRNNPIDAGDVVFLVNTVGATLLSIFDARYSPGDLDGIMFDNVLDRPYYGVATNRPATVGSPAGGTGSDVDATLAFWSLSANYVNAWKTLLQYMRNRLVFSGQQIGAAGFLRHGKIWGNTGGSVLDFINYPADSLDNRLVEFFNGDGAASPNCNRLANQHTTLRNAAAMRGEVMLGFLRISNAAANNLIVDANAVTGNAEGVQGGAPQSGGDEMTSRVFTWPKLATMIRDYGLLKRASICTARTSSGGVLMHHKVFGPVI